MIRKLTCLVEQNVSKYRKSENLYTAPKCLMPD